MVFSSSVFLFAFLPICITGYYILKNKCGNEWLFFLSLLFYVWGGLSFFPVICVSILLNYMSGLLLDKCGLAGREGIRKAVFWAAVAANLLILGYWKYLNFFAESLGYVLGMDFGLKKILLPIGISFYTFQGISYVIDVYRRQVPVQKKIVNLGLYIALFPQLIAGPIVRYSDINEQLAKREHSVELFAAGIRRFSVGLAKKAVLANSLAVNADAVFAMPSVQNTPDVAWLGAVSYMLQIYFDFSGYSDMAIGLGKMFGFHILENFDYPYISRSIPEFWRRWHISLGSWFRDYVFYPVIRTKWCSGLGNLRNRFVGKNLAKMLPTIAGTLIIWSLTGLWHGANWTFVCWGTFHGVLITASMLIKKKVKKFNDKHHFTKTKYFDVFRILRTDFLVLIGLVFFKADSIRAAFLYLKSMFGFLDVHQAGYRLEWYLTKYDLFILAVSFVAMLPVGKCALNWMETKMSKANYVLMCNIGSLVLLGTAIMYVITSTYNPFIYFQF